MADGLRRTELQQLAKSKLADAHLLLVNNRYSNSYYLAGYSVEFGLKACICQQMYADVIPEKKYINSIYNHHPKVLAGLAGLNSSLEHSKRTDAQFAANWAIVTEWDPEIRYRPVDPYSSQSLYDAISEPNHGVFEWIKKHW